MVTKLVNYPKQVHIQSINQLHESFSLTIQNLSFSCCAVCTVFCIVNFILVLCSSSATFSTQPTKELVCMLQPCKLRTLPLQQILYHSAAFPSNLLLRCTILLYPVLVTNLKLLVVLNVFRYRPPIENVLLHTMEGQISGLHRFNSCKQLS